MLEYRAKERDEAHEVFHKSRRGLVAVEGLRVVEKDKEIAGDGALDNPETADSWLLDSKYPLSKHQQAALAQWEKPKRIRKRHQKSLIL